MGSAAPAEPEKALQLIKENLQEVLNEEIIEDCLFKQKRPLRIYWGTTALCAQRNPTLLFAELCHRHSNNR